MTKEELIKLISTDEGFESYLNSVRAEGVEYVAQSIANVIKNNTVIGTEDYNSLMNIHRALLDSAAQLRAGEPS